MNKQIIEQITEQLEAAAQHSGAKSFIITVQPVDDDKQPEKTIEDVRLPHFEGIRRKSGYPGVKQRGPNSWHAQMVIFGRLIYLGSGSTEEEAIRVRKAGERVYKVVKDMMQVKKRTVALP